MNTRTPAQLKDALDAIAAELRAIETTAIADAELVPLANCIKDVAAYAVSVNARIVQRVLTDGVSVPGAARKAGISHRKWNDEEAAKRAAYDQFGKEAFECTLKSPAGIEKLGEAGKAFAALASYKPAASDRVVY